MAANSTSSKVWCITIVSAILVIVAEKGKANFSLLALPPSILFLALDAYYLAVEKGFRISYRMFVTKVHDGTLSPEDLYSITPEGQTWSLQWEAFKSFSVWGFYITLLTLILLAR